MNIYCIQFNRKTKMEKTIKLENEIRQLLKTDNNSELFVKYET